VKDPNSSTGGPFADEVKIDLDMFRALVLDQVGGEVDDADVVSEDQGARGQWTVELLEQLTKPGRHVPILGLGAGAGDDWLALRRPRDVAITEEHGIPRGGAARVWTARLVGIGVDAKLGGRGPLKKKPEAKSATQVPHDPLHRGEVRFPRVVHVEAHLLDGVGDVEPGEDEVLKGPDSTPVTGRSGDRGAVAETLPCVSIGVAQGLHSAMLACSRRSTVYCRW
jgi:hypothetical protein